MARGGLFGRIGRIFKRAPAPPPPRQPPERPPPKEPADEYRRIWRRERGTGNYRQHLKVFHSMIDPIESDPRERQELWESYITNIIRPRGRERRQSPSNMFWRDSGIDPIDFNWSSWRQAMGYTGSRRSRTP